MKYYSIIVIALLITSCKVQEDVKRVLPLETEAVQTFLVNVDQDTVIIGKKGTRIKFPKTCFVDSAGTEVKEQVEISMAEFNNIQDFINNRLSTTTTEGQILVSSGMVFLSAKSANKSLQLKPTSPITIMFPRIIQSDVANLFSGQRGKNNEIQWKLLDPVHYDTIVVLKLKNTRWLLSEIDPDELVKQISDEDEIDVEFIIGPDTIQLTDKNREDFDKVIQRTPGFTRGLEAQNSRLTRSDTLQYYIFETAQLGYLNCDIFLKDELYSFTVETTNTESSVVVILDSLNSTIYPDSTLNVSVNNNVNSLRSFNLPKNKSVTIVSILADKDGRYYFGMSKSNTLEKKVSVNLEEHTLEEIKEKIKQL